MSVNSNTYEMSGEALVSQESTPSIFTITDFCYGLVNFDINPEAMATILAKRDVDGTTAFSEVEKQTRDLLEADIYVWICLGVSKKGSVSDHDNGWSHSEGGYSLTESDKRLMLNKANAIYSQYDEPSVGKTKVRISSFGVMPANVEISGDYINHTV